MDAMTMPTMHVGQGTHLGALSVFPVWAESPVVPGMDSGRAANVQAAEREGSPVVGELVLKNVGAKPALLLAGELFEGGWQHRALNHDVLLLAGQQMVASVSCVESGRWHGVGAQVRRGRRASMLVRSAQTSASAADRQGLVWERVSHYDQMLGASATSSYVEHLDRSASRPPQPEAGDQGGALREGLRAVRALAGQRGVLIGLGGQPAFLELFATPAGLRRNLAGLLEAAALDAELLPDEPTPGRRARRFVGSLTSVPLAADRGADAGAGHALAARSRNHEIRALGWDEHLLHASVFNRRHPLMQVA